MTEQKKFDVKQLREKALNSDDIQYDEVYVSEWDVTLPVKTLSSAEMKKVMKDDKNHVRMMILAVIYGCKTEDGEQIFEEKDLAKLETEKSFSPIVKVGTKIFEISGLSEDAVDEAKNS